MSDIHSRLAGARSSLAFKAPCRAIATSNITLSGTQTINAVAVVAEDRVLVNGQTSSVNNGIYVVKALAWERARDFDGTDDVVTGTRVYVHSGSLAGCFVVSSADPIVIGTSAITFAAATVDYNLTAQMDDEFGSTRGAMIYRGASEWDALAASTSGYHLQTNGAATDPTWVGFLQAGTGAQTRTWQSKAREIGRAHV